LGFEIDPDKAVDLVEGIVLVQLCNQMAEVRIQLAVERIQKVVARIQKVVVRILEEHHILLLVGDQKG
jgi:hypothetical protein